MGSVLVSIFDIGLLVFFLQLYYYDTAIAHKSDEWVIADVDTKSSGSILIHSPYYKNDQNYGILSPTQKVSAKGNFLKAYVRATIKIAFTRSKAKGILILAMVEKKDLNEKNIKSLLHSHVV
ncbi:MAG: hypothetical protein ACTMUB_10290 [cyanobacterium endosymbiont of Rhopalodia musculus]|uniref:hypothetical protein n=1 Tax=cyanobacterium endosymbiont of Epithemia clementina EcSB TaxID=3034674 RepID=UPI0024809F4B|nr:hypothetical protein [cyanobacterium endosymbiont of Epithemia clementina EcSB]WGT66654.1 hypothetical protein P3F56_05075 [cyanobacterium endosymbiont of Epithemia clementina EcSB]